MKLVAAVALIFLGVYGLWTEQVRPARGYSSALSEAAQIESDVRAWAESKTLKGELSEEDLLEIFPDGATLRTAAARSDEGLRGIILDLMKASSERPPVIDAIAVLIGFATLVGWLIDRIKTKAQQGMGLDAG